MYIIIYINSNIIGVIGDVSYLDHNLINLDSSVSRRLVLSPSQAGAPIVGIIRPGL